MRVKYEVIDAPLCLSCSCGTVPVRVQRARPVPAVQDEGTGSGGSKAVGELLQLFFEKEREGGGKVAAIPEEQAAIITFQDPKVTEPVQKRKHYICKAPGLTANHIEGWRGNASRVFHSIVVSLCTDQLTIIKPRGKTKIFWRTRCHLPDSEGTKADISRFMGDTVVNAANEDLKHIGGLAATLLQVVGRQMQEASDKYVRKNGQLSPGDAAITEAGRLLC
ncbi:hypothetical protein AAFF_G00302730 [Aldrovandia affinis]|uniref:Macro domain-containing protein n=1 Tax=Aldrovandia affinis TaxID=143900 RepID=A0AAD7RAU6_9TELE|nr:hypothetical protein AAFF_G00302730 [Aldrovandia affinis]